MSIPLPPSAPTHNVASDPQALAREHTLTAINTLSGIASRGASESARVAAANSLLERGWGKPAPSEENTNINVTLTMSPSEAYRTLIDGSK